MMESINVIVDAIQHEVVSEEEKEYTNIKHHVTLYVLKKGTNITLSPEDENSEVEEDSIPGNKGSSIIFHKIHPIENIIGDLNEGVITRSKEVITNMYFISKSEPKNVKEVLKDEY